MLYKAHSTVSIEAHFLRQSEHSFYKLCSFIDISERSCPLVALIQQVLKPCPDHSNRWLSHKAFDESHELALSVSALIDTS